MRLFYLLSLLVFSACGTDILSDSPCGKCDPQPIEASCGSAKIACSCPPHLPPTPAVCSGILFDYISHSMNERNYLLYGDLLSPDFKFVDETTGTEIVGREQEVSSVKHVFDTHRDVEYTFIDSSREEAEDGCVSLCGSMEMVLVPRDDPTFEVKDKACLTSCQSSEDSLWYLSEWRILKSLLSPPGDTWGEVKRGD